MGTYKQLTEWVIQHVKKIRSCHSPRFPMHLLCQSWVGLTSNGVVQGRGLIGWRDLQLFFKDSLPGMYSLHVPEMPLVKRQQGHRV